MQHFVCWFNWIYLFPRYSYSSPENKSCDMWLCLSVPCDVFSYIQQTTTAPVTQLDIFKPTCRHFQTCLWRPRLATYHRTSHPWWWRQKQVCKALNMNQNRNTALWWEKQKIQPQRKFFTLLSAALQKRTGLPFVLVIGSLFCRLTDSIWSLLSVSV